MRILPLFIVLALGCGLSDYEKRMDTQRDWLKHFDEENRLLDEPLEMPKLIMKTKDEVDGFPFEVFLRPPNEIKKEAGKDAYFAFDGIPLFRYRGGEAGQHLLVGASLVADKEDQDGETPDDFKRKTLLSFNEYHRKVYQQDVKLTAPPAQESVKPLSLKGPWPDMELERFDFVDKGRSKSDFKIYLHRRGPHQVAVIYQFPSDKASDSRKAMEHSLKTLTIEADKVLERKEEYDLRNRFPK